MLTSRRAAPTPAPTRRTCKAGRAPSSLASRSDGVSAKTNTRTTQRPPGRITVLGGLCFVTALGLLAAGRSFPSYASVKAILDDRPEQLPAELRNLDEAKWLAWSQQRDKVIRARLEQGDLDSLVNLLLLGTSFTKQPRIRMETLTEASKAGVLRARVDDLVAGLRSPSENE